MRQFVRQTIINDSLGIKSFHLMFSFFRNFREASNGRGKGCGIFSLSSRKMSHETIVVKEKYQVITFVDETVPKFTYQLVLVYLSTGCPLSQVVDDLSHMLIPNIRTVITGDFNFNKTEQNSLTEFLKNKSFQNSNSKSTCCM